MLDFFNLKNIYLENSVTMKIFLTEEKLSLLLTRLMLEQNLQETNNYNPYARKIEQSNKALEDLLAREGRVLLNIENGKEYLTYEITSLANTIGKRYCVCRLIRNNEPYGAIYTKPMTQFKMKTY